MLASLSKSIVRLFVVAGVTAVTLISNQVFAANGTDYFARFKYDVDTAVQMLKAADGKPLEQSPEARAFLDDMGFWRQVRSSGPFRMDAALEGQLRAQFKYLEKAFTYEAGDLVWVNSENAADRTYGVGSVNHRAIIRDTFRMSDTDFYVVEVLVDGPDKMARIDGKFYDGRPGKLLYYGDQYQLRSETRLLTKAELDTLNSPGSSLPKDNQGEVLDWEGDKIWLDKLEAFKKQMVKEGLQIDWSASPKEILAMQTRIMRGIFHHFKMNRNAPGNNGQGIGKRASGGGVCFDQALVLTYAIQGIGQTSGIKAINLSGQTVNPEGGHGFVRIDLKTAQTDVTFDRVYSYQDWQTARATGRPITSQPTYAGVTLRANNFIGISDPGWADYGVTPDQFALMDVASSLNPIPVDSNRAVRGVSSQRALIEVIEKVGAKGAFAKALTAQRILGLTPEARKRLFEEFEKNGRKLNSDFEKAATAILAQGGSCKILFKN